MIPTSGTTISSARWSLSPTSPTINFLAQPTAGGQLPRSPAAQHKTDGVVHPDSPKSSPKRDNPAAPPIICSFVLLGARGHTRALVYSFLRVAITVFDCRSSVLSVPRPNTRCLRKNTRDRGISYPRFPRIHRPAPYLFRGGRRAAFFASRRSIRPGETSSGPSHARKARLVCVDSCGRTAGSCV